MSGEPEVLSTSQTTTVTQSVVVSTVGEPRSVITCREVEDWCRDCREYRPPIVSAINLSGFALGALIGFVTAFASTDRKTSGVWWGVFLLGTIIAAGVSAVALIAATSPWIRARFTKEKPTSSLAHLADRMERAKDMNRGEIA